MMTAAGAGGNAGAAVSSVSVSACGPELLMSGASGKIAFDSDRQDFNRDLYVVNVDGSGLTRLTLDPSTEKEPAFSPDGTQISFSSDRALAGTFQIYLLDLSTMQVTQVTDLADGADESSFSHDGSLIAFHSAASVWVVHPDGTGPTLVATGDDSFNAYFWPHFSLDDSELVFDRNNEIDAVHLDGSGFRRIVNNWTTTIKSPAVSPAGTDVAYAVQCDQQLSVWTTPFSTATDPCKGRRVTPVGDTLSQRPAWGPNNLIAYERVDSGTNVGSIAVISRTGGSVPCLLAADLNDNRNPAWSF
jgi:Tol biopolymer transport system component